MRPKLFMVWVELGMGGFQKIPETCKLACATLSVVKADERKMWVEQRKTEGREKGEPVSIFKISYSSH